MDSSSRPQRKRGERNSPAGDLGKERGEFQEGRKGLHSRKAGEILLTVRSNRYLDGPRRGSPGDGLDFVGKELKEGGLVY